MISQILRRAAHLAQVTGHLHAAHDGAGEQALADGAGTAMPAFGAVRGITAGEFVALARRLRNRGLW